MNTGSPAPTGNNASLSQQESPFEYSAIVASPLVNGEAKLALSEGALLVTALFDAVEIPFAEINELRFENYTVFIESDSGAYAFSRMGQWAQPFYDALYDSYNKAVLRSLFIKGEPLVTAQGEYRYTENALTASGKAPFYVYENCLALLPPNLAARRIPLCFVRALDKEDFSLTLSLDTQERYSFSKLGYDTAPFANAVEKQLRALHQKALAAVKELDASLAAAQATQIAKLTLEGTAAPLGRLAALAPSASVRDGELSYNIDGVNYYRVPLRHFNNETQPEAMAYGRFGVVRNNVYELTVGSIVGPGRVTIDPDPEIPDEWIAGFISVRLQILPWILRVYDQPIGEQVSEYEYYYEIEPTTAP